MIVAACEKRPSPKAILIVTDGNRLAAKIRRAEGSGLPHASRDCRQRAEVDR